MGLFIWGGLSHFLNLMYFTIISMEMSFEWLWAHNKMISLNYKSELRRLDFINGASPLLQSYFVVRAIVFEKNPKFHALCSTFSGISPVLPKGSSIRPPLPYHHHQAPNSGQELNYSFPAKWEWGEERPPTKKKWRRRLRVKPLLFSRLSTTLCIAPCVSDATAHEKSWSCYSFRCWGLKLQRHHQGNLRHFDEITSLKKTKVCYYIQ